MSSMKKLYLVVALAFVGLSLFGCNLLERYKIEPSADTKAENDSEESSFEVVETINLPNTVYIGKFGDEWALFLQNSSERNFVESRLIFVSNDTYEGLDYNINAPERFDQLEDPRIVYQGKESEEIYISPSIIDESNNKSLVNLYHIVPEFF